MSKKVERPLGCPTPLASPRALGRCQHRPLGALRCVASWLLWSSAVLAENCNMSWKTQIDSNKNNSIKPERIIRNTPASKPTSRASAWRQFFRSSAASSRPCKRDDTVMTHQENKQFERIKEVNGPLYLGIQYQLYYKHGLTA